MARQASPHSAASVCSRTGSRWPNPRSSLSRRFIDSLPGDRVERIEHPFIQTAPLQSDVGLQLHARLQIDFPAVRGDALSHECYGDAVHRLQASDARELCRQLARTHSRAGNAGNDTIVVAELLVWIRLI